MSYYTLEHTIKSMSGCKKPLYSSRRVYRTLGQVKERVRQLRNEWGEDNVLQMKPKYDDDTTVVFIRID